MKFKKRKILKKLNLSFYPLLSVSGLLILSVKLITSEEIYNIEFNNLDSLILVLSYGGSFSLVLFHLYYEFSKKYKQIKTNTNKLPSKFSLFIAAALQKPEDREFVLGCIEERFKKDVKKRGYIWAKLMLWRDNLVALWAAFGDKTVRFLKWIGFGYLIEKLFVLFR